MSNYFWFKFPYGRLNDPVIALLPDRLWRRYHELYTVAGITRRGGLLPEESFIAFQLRISLEDLLLDLKQLASIDKLRKTPNGWLVVDFEREQARIPDDERKAAERERDREGHEEVTTRDNDVTRYRYRSKDKDIRSITSSSSLPPPPQSNEPAGDRQEEEVLSLEFQSALKELGVFEPLWPKVLQSPWTDDQIWQLIQDVKSEWKEGKLNNGKPGAIFMYRLNQTTPPMTQAEREELDRKKYISGPYAGIFANNREGEE